jgi:gamma-glutamyltranspeptidase/glutathione hydrolase
LVAPALGLARAGVPLDEAHLRVLRSLESGLLLGEGALAYAPAGKLLAAGETVYHPGLDHALQLLAQEGAGTFYDGLLADAIVHAVIDGGGVLGARDLSAYEVRELPPTSVPFADHTVHGRVDLNHTLEALAALPRNLRALSVGERAVAVARALGGPELLGDTTNVTVVDPEGNACVVTTTLGLGSGVWLPGFGIHLNSMLGEGELIRGVSPPGERMGSMMCPLVVEDEDGLALAGGAAGASRIRTALTHALVGVIAEGASPAEAVARPRIHRVGDLVHAEAGVPTEAVTALTQAGYTIRQWSSLDHYFGGASVIGRRGAGGDPRRGGAALLL